MIRRNNRSSGMAGGFTLMELLVVIAIISILMSILLPALAGARKLSKRTACGANLHSIYTALALYTHENDSLLPTTAPMPPQTSWVSGASCTFMIKGSATANPGSVDKGPHGWFVLMSRGYLDGTSLSDPSTYNPKGVALPKVMQCPGMDWTVTYTGTAMGHYDYRFNSNPFGYNGTGYVATDLTLFPSKPTLNMDGWQYRIILNDAAGSRVNGNRVITVSDGPAKGNNNDQRWAHEDGGNMATMDGAVAWVPNKLTIGITNASSGSWPTDRGIGAFYIYQASGVEYGLDRLTKQ